MRLKTILIGLAVSCLVLGALGVTAAKPAGDGAFLTDYAASISQVVDQVEANRLVALRYAKHFRTDPSSVLTFFRNELTVETLSESASMEMYYLGSSRNIESTTVEFKAGTKVFANKAGLPILQFGTGNPLSNSLSTGPGAKALANPATTAPAGTVVAEVLDQPPMELAPMVNTDATVAAIPPGAEDSGTIVAALPDAGPAPVSTGGGGSSLLSSVPSWVLPVGIAGAAAAFSGGGGSSDNRTTDPTAPPVSDDPGTQDPPIIIPDDPGGDNPVVPEPASMLVLTSGCIGVAGLVFRKRRS